MNEPPRLPDPPPAYDAVYMAALLDTLRVFFETQAVATALRGTRLNLDLRTLPTQAAVASLRPGDVYVDTSAGNVLKIKT